MQKKIKMLTIIFFFGLVGRFFYLKSSPSSYKAACCSLGFATPVEQEALYNILKMAGYLEPEDLWEAVYRSNIFSNPEAVFSELSEPSKFLHTKKYSAVEFAKLLLYISQTAFDRKFGQERSELNVKAWMVDSRTDYFDHARALGLMHTIKPDFKIEYDAALVLGASRGTLYSRLIELASLLKQGLKTNSISALAGERELWAEIDGCLSSNLQLLDLAKLLGVSVDAVDLEDVSDFVADKTKEGKDYLQDLADRLAISYNKDNAFEYRDNRSYLRSLDKATLTETTMAEDLISKFPEMKFAVLDTAAQDNGQRPDTVSTARHFAEQFVQSIIDQKIEKRLFHIIAVSNNPYTRRQAIAVQRECNNALKSLGVDGFEIKVHGVGFKARADVATIHSELGALFSELFKDAYPFEDTQHLMFRSRNNDSFVPEHQLLKFVEYKKNEK